MSKNGSLRVGSGGERNGVTSWSETKDESGKWFVLEEIWVVSSGSLGLSFCHSKSWLRSLWLEEAELLVMTRVSSITSFADIISTLVEEMVTSTIDKALCVVYNEGERIPKVS